MDGTLSELKVEEIELNELQNLNVWGRRQEDLEAQALQELEIFAANQTDSKEDGEITNNDLSPNNIEENVSKINQGKSTLDISSYIMQQQEFKKRQDHKKSLQISDKSRNIANEISKRESTLLKRKKEHKISKVRKKRKTVEDDKKELCTQKVDISKEESICKDKHSSGSEYNPSEADSDYEPGFGETPETPKKRNKKLKGPVCPKIDIEKVTDDGSLKLYQARLEKYYTELEQEQIESENINLGDHVERKFGMKINRKIWENLYSYQQEGVEWLWALYDKSQGGLLGDEMGLGKTVQIIAFLEAVNFSRKISSHGCGLGATIIVCPSTVLHQWVKHFHDWAPEFRVAVLHQSGSFSGNKINLIKEMNKCKGIIITTYQSMLKYKGNLKELNWHFIILDEGHKIRNANAKVTIAIKEFQTPYRLLLTGSPMQNNLQELWSLFDFINPGMLGSIQAFMEHFAVPIMHGGYSNATPMQEALALSMATALKNMIDPHLLRRAKADVKEDICLPNKSEQVLFCTLTNEQRDLYKGYLMGDKVSAILGRGKKNWYSENYTRGNVLMAITTLRKICNHPDIYIHNYDDEEFNDAEIAEDKYGYYKRSGKMIVVSALLKIWKKQEHRVLLFTQSRMMIKIFQNFLEENCYKYLKMDGGTAVTSRQALINKFNSDASYDVFLLTTRVGGLGVNLTGANRVIIYDPDWNPATDTQARERAWRIGQEKQVTIYRLLSAGTIEEKIYQRQVWKQLLSNKVLLDPKTQKFFRTSDLHDLFSLQEQINSNTETSNIFQNSRISMENCLNEKKKLKNSKEVSFSDDKIEKMKQLAAQISKNISAKSTSSQSQKRTATQIELEVARNKKLEERANLKKLTPNELRIYNRQKLLKQEEDLNKIDDKDTDVSFTKALVISEKTAEIYKEAKCSKTNIDDATDQYTSLTEIFSKEQKDKRKKTKNYQEALLVDNSGTIDGEKIDGLMKMEIKKQKRIEKSKNKVQDNYVLEKLFSKKGVCTALQHDSVVHSTSKMENSIKIHSEAQFKTDLALQALRKSRVNKWSW